MIINLKNDHSLDTDDIEDYAEFLVYDKGTSYYQGFYMAAFMMLCNSHGAIKKNYITKYFNNRVYFELWSQNNLPPIKFIEKYYYDASMDAICFRQDLFGNCSVLTLSTIDIGRLKFNGAKTKQQFFDFLENYECLKKQLVLTY